MDQLGVYEILVKQNEQMLFAYIMGIIKDPSWAEDIVQEAFVKAYENLASLKNKEAFGSWLRTIARNVALTELKRKKKEITIEPQILIGMKDIFSHVENSLSGFFGIKRIPWNFTKFLFDKNGISIKKFATITKSEKIEQDIQKLLQ
jgi:RNA polymerase sigma factor (sigma-70 family)